MSSLGAHLVQRITADLDFLKAQSLLSQSDYDSILARLPGPDGLRRAPLHEQLAMVTLSDPSPNGETARPMPPPLPGRPGSALSTGWGDGRPRCRAVWNYPMGQPDDLPFVKGEVIVIEEEMNDDWWRGSLNGRTGIFPSNHVERLPGVGRQATPNPQQQQYGAPTGPSMNYAPQNGYGQQNNSQSFSPYPQQGYQPPPPNNYNQMQYQSYQQKPEYNNTPPPQQMAPYQAQQVASSQPQQPPAPPKKGRFGGGGMGGTLAHALVGGVGFGAGSAVGSDIIHSIF